MKYRLRDRGLSDPGPSQDRIDVGYSIDTEVVGRDKTYRLTAILSEEMRMDLIGHGGSTIPDGNSVDGPLGLFAVCKLERFLKNGSFPPVGQGAPAAVTYTIRREDLPAIMATASEKQCVHRRGEEPDFFCSAAEEIRTGIVPGPVAITPAICRDCHIPDTRGRCSHLAHAKVTVSHLVGGGMKIFCRAMCNAEKRDVKEVNRCRVGGHPCWERFVVVGQSERSRVFVAEALPEALDFLNATWRLAFKSHRFLQLRSASNAAALVSNCSTRADFAACLSAFDDVMKSIKVSEGLLPEAGRADDKLKGDQTFNRLEACIRKQVTDQGLRQAAIDAIEVLRNASRIRVALQHSGKADDLPELLAGFGLSLGDEWADLWNGIRARVTGALIEIRTVIETLVDSEEGGQNQQ